MINRSVLIVRPKQPFLDWAALSSESGVVPNVDGEQTAYLVPSCGTDDDVREVLHEVCVIVFENELWGWHTDQSRWPEKRDLETFEAWFSIEVHTLVEDLCDYELVDEDDD